MSAPSIDEKAVFNVARRIDSYEARAQYLRQVCGEDEDSLRRLVQLLQVHENEQSFLELPAVTAEAGHLFDQPLESPGAQIGPYKLLQQIGEGGMGVVFMAQQLTPIKRLVALKLIKPGMDTKQVIARFEAERQALALMDHPNIAKVLDAGTIGEAEASASGSGYPPAHAGGSPGRPYFVMELVRGTPITEYCELEQTETQKKLELFVDVCRAVHHAHQKGIIHRDLKPNNVLVTMHDGVPVVKVIDFGVAKALNQELTERTLFTQFAQMIGTPLYMSPEQAEMSGLGIDTRSDVYSLGVLLYELLTGTTPFDKATLASAGFDEMRRIIREEEPETISVRIAKTRSAERGMRNGSSSAHSALRTPRWNELDWIVMKALEKDRNRRYESASSLAADIQRYLDDEPVQACPPRALYRFQKFARRNKRALFTLTVIATVLVASLVALAVAYTQVSQKQQQTQAALERERQTLYYHRIALADSSYWLANDVGQAERLLDECPQALRQWEWHYLKRLCHADSRTLAHSTPVFSLAVTGDGQRLATGIRKLILIWDTRTGRQLHSLSGHTDNVGGLSFSPDGKRLASASWDGSVKLWDVSSGEEIRTLRGHQGPVYAVAFSPADDVLVSGGQDQVIRVWDASTGDERLRAEAHRGPIRALAFSRDGRRLVSGSEDQTARLWDAGDYRELRVLEGHTSFVHGVAFDPEGRLVATGSQDWTAKIWDASTGQEQQTLRGHKHFVASVAFSTDGKQLATASHDQTIKLWDVSSGQEQSLLRGHKGLVHQVVFADEGQLISAGNDQTVKIWDLANPQGEPLIRLPQREAHAAAFSPEGLRLAVAGGDNNVTTWDATTGTRLRVLAGHAWRVWDVAFSPDGKLLASAGGRRNESEAADVKIWDARTGQELLTLRGHTDSVRKVAFSPDGRQLASASHDHTVKLWDVATGHERNTLTGHTREVVGVAFSPDGSLLASASFDATVKLWNAATGEPIRTFSSHHRRANNVAFSPDGHRLAAVGSTLPSCVKIWNVATGDEILSLPTLTTLLHGLAYSPDGRRIATMGYDGVVKIWDAATGHDILSLRGHTNDGWSAAFSPDGSRLATASYDGTVRIWDAAPLHVEYSQPDQ